MNGDAAGLRKMKRRVDALETLLGVGTHAPECTAHDPLLQRMHHLVADAARMSGCRIAAILGDIRDARLVRVRDAVAMVAREDFTYTWQRIGDGLGGREHSTIKASLKRARALILADADFATFVRELRLLTAERAAQKDAA